MIFIKKLTLIWKRYSYIILITLMIIGLFDFRIALLAIFCMIGPIILSIYKGRFWCGNLCPRGSFYDNVVFKFSNRKPVPKFFKSIFFRTIITIFMFYTVILDVMKNLGNLYKIGFIFYKLIVVTTFIGIILALFYNHRSWCNFCPMGNIASLISFFRNKKNSSALLKVNNSCTSCKLCEYNCPMGIRPYEFKGKSITHKDCIQCHNCVYVCPKKSIK